MNKGRNIAIAMAVMLCISIQFFFMLLGRNNTSGVVRKVRYVFQEGELEDDTVKYYKFYYVDEGARDVTVTTLSDGRICFTVQDYDYTYYLEGTNKKNCKVTYEYTGRYTPSEEEAYSIYSPKLFTAMVFGKEALLKLYEAIIVSAIAAAGAIIFGKAENIWEKFNRKKYPEGYEPVWDDFRMYRVWGGAMMAAAAVLMVLFILF